MQFDRKTTIRGRIYMLLCAALFLLSACAPAVSSLAESVATSAAATSTEADSTEPISNDTATPTATATESWQPSPTPTSTPSVPTLTTHTNTNVRRGPGFDYEVLYVAPGGASALVLGRSPDGQWLATSQPGSPHTVLSGWIAAWVVTVHGDLSTLPIMEAPPLPATPTPEPLPPTLPPGPPTSQPPTPTAVASVPVHIDPGSPPSTACVAVNPNEGVFVNVHLGPGAHFGLAALLGNWAEVVSSTNGWYQVLLGPGATGWVNGADVDLIGPC